MNTIPSGDLDRLLITGECLAREVLRERGQVPPIFLAKTPTGVVLFTPEHLSDNRDKDVFAHWARVVCLAHGAGAAVLIIEAWLATTSPDSPLEMAVPPSEAPDRREVVIIAGESRTGARNIILPIVRDPAGVCLGAGEVEDPDPSSLQGRFTHFIPPRVPSRQQMRLARRALAQSGVMLCPILPDLSAN